MRAREDFEEVLSRVPMTKCTVLVWRTSSTTCHGRNTIGVCLLWRKACVNRQLVVSWKHELFLQRPPSDRNPRSARPARRRDTQRVRMNNGKDKGLSCNQAFMHESVMGIRESSLPMSMRKGRWCTSMKGKHRITGGWTGTEVGQRVCRSKMRHVV